MTYKPETFDTAYGKVLAHAFKHSSDQNLIGFSDTKEMINITYQLLLAHTEGRWDDDYRMQISEEDYGVGEVLDLIRINADILRLLVIQEFETYFKKNKDPHRLISQSHSGASDAKRILMLARLFPVEAATIQISMNNQDILGRGDAQNIVSVALRRVDNEYAYIAVKGPILPPISVKNIRTLIFRDWDHINRELRAILTEEREGPNKDKPALN